MTEPWESGKYASESYLQGLAASSRDLQGQVGSALSEIVKQRNLAHEKAAMLPGAVNQAQDAGVSQLNAGLQQLGLGPMSQTLAGVFQGNRDAYGQAAGLLHTGFTEQAAQRHASVEGIRQQILAGYQQDANRYIGNRQAEDRAREFAAQEAERQRALQVEIAGQQSQNADAVRRAQADEEARNRWFQAQQGNLNRQNEQSMARLALGPAAASRPAPKPKAAPKPKSSSKVTRVGRYN